MARARETDERKERNAKSLIRDCVPSREFASEVGRSSDRVLAGKLRAAEESVEQRVNAERKPERQGTLTESNPRRLPDVHKETRETGENDENINKRTHINQIASSVTRYSPNERIRIHKGYMFYQPNITSRPHPPASEIALEPEPSTSPAMTEQRPQQERQQTLSCLRHIANQNLLITRIRIKSR